MSNTLFNDAALNLKVEIPSGGIEHNQLNTTNVFTVTTSSSLSSANLKYSSLKVKIAEGSKPINGVFSEIKSLNNSTFVLAHTLACFNNPFDIKERPDSQ